MSARARRTLRPWLLGAVLCLLSAGAGAQPFQAWAPFGAYELTALREGSAFVTTLPTREGPVEVSFQPRGVLASGYHAEQADGRGRRQGIGRPPVTTYTGAVAPASQHRDFAKLAAGPRLGAVSGLLRVAGVLYDLEGTREGSQPGLHVSEITPEELGQILSGCGVHTERAAGLSSEGATADGGSTADAPDAAGAGSLREIELGTEADALFVSQSGGVDEANARILAIVNALNGIYEADLGLTNRVVVQRAWSGSDPYTSSDSGTLLTQFRSEFSRDIATVYDDAQLFSGRDFESSVIGRAWVSSACTSYRYGVNQGFGLSDSYIRLLVAHEEGHNLGAGHSDAGIMTPSLSPSVTWFNDASQAEIGSYVGSVGCLEPVVEGAPPSLDPIGPQSVAEGSRLELQLTASDPDGDDLSFGATPLPPGASMSPDGLFLYEPPFDHVGCGGASDLAIEFFVTDTSGQRVSEIVPITVADQPTGAIPVLVDPPDRSVRAGEIVQIQLQASDADGDSLGFDATGLPADAVLSASGLFTWTPSNADAGAHAIVFAVVDCTGRSASQEVRIDVVPVLAPHLSGLSPDSGPAGSEVRISGTDLAGGVLEVRFGAKTAPISSASDTLLVVTAPRQRKGTSVVDVTVVRDGRASDNSLPFAYSGGGGKGGGGKGGGRGKLGTRN